MKLIRTAIIIIVAIVVFCFFGWKWGYLQFQLPLSTDETSTDTPSVDEVRGWKDSLAAIEALLSSPDAKNLSSEKLKELREEFGEISGKLEGLDEKKLREGLGEISDKLKGEVSERLKAVSRLLKEKRQQIEDSGQETATPKERRTRQR